MLKHIFKYVTLLSMLALSACVTVPTGPSVMVMPAPGKPFEVFTQEDSACRHWAEQQIGLSPQEVVEKNTATGAVVGTAIGTGVGALLGAASGHAGSGALIGGASGLVIGTASGADSGQVYGREAQRRYDTAYMQCMYANGNQIAGNRRVIRRTYRSYPPPPPPPLAVPPQSYDAIQPQSYDAIPPPPVGETPQTPPELLEYRQDIP